MRKINLTLIISTVVLFLFNCEILTNDTDTGNDNGDSSELSILLNNIGTIDMEQSATRTITGSITSDFEIDDEDISISIEDSANNNALKYFEITKKEISPTKEIDLYQDLNLKLNVLSDIPSGQYTFKITATYNEYSDSKTSTFLVENFSGTTADNFPYYKGSEFTFVIQKGVNSVSTTVMDWTVTEYDSSTTIATISNTEEPANSLPATFYFRQADNGGLEYSENKSSWRNLTVPSSNSNVNFLFATKAAKPSSLLGSVSNGVKATTVSIPDSSVSGVNAYSEYDQGSSDSYIFIDNNYEHYCNIGFAYSYSYTSDHSDYPAFTYKRVVKLVSYKILFPDGTIKEAGETTPDAPSNFSASYKKNIDTWNPSTGTYEKRTYVSMSWIDNSDNETEFKLYIKVPGSDWESAADAIATNGVSTFYPTTFPSGNISGSVRAGYYVSWGSGVYMLKLTATTVNDESEYSNEASVSVY